MRLTTALIAAASLAAHSASAGPVKRDTEYDYVVVGGGTAGLAIAARLSEDPKVQVAVIEPGTYYQISNMIVGEVPAGCSLFAGSDPADTNSAVDWDIVTTPQEGAMNRSLHIARGKCLGGSSARHYMVYQRGDKGCYQQWADDVGDQSYTWDNLLPYFQKSVNFTAPRAPPRAANATADYNPAAFTNGSGPLRVTYTNYASPISSWVQKGLTEIGILPTQDFNSGSLLGSGYAASTIDPKTMKRESSQTSYYEPAKNRLNFRTFILSKASKVVFDANKKATGVQLTDGQFIKANKEVILSAGVFQSPQLLMLSGIGPKATLDKYNITVIADRPGVGQNLTDHAFFAPSYRVKVETFTRLASDLIYIATQYLFSFIGSQTGPLTNPVADFLAFERLPGGLVSPDTQKLLDEIPTTWPHIEYTAASGHIGNFSNLRKDQPKDGYQYGGIMVALTAAFSRGTVGIKSASIDDLPVVDPKYLTHPGDVEVAVAAFKRARKVYASEAMADVLADPNEYYPGVGVQTDEQITEAIRKSIGPLGGHGSCTCRMGRVDDPNAVVDNKARVIGVTGLRVVDASSFAILPPGHPQATVYALAEKIADEIKKGN
ncbi:Dehydrogenase patE [Vanrija pseudolonga]|uniref:Dehydrogenase patE n=1 Tax=Vanrija pseudolonga TaxID=143232 RepID=A0AAF0YIX5_9TREE|nr:Dehydrogenase patE [Vanrija pseudolonga]